MSLPPEAALLHDAVFGMGLMCEPTGPDLALPSIRYRDRRLREAAARERGAVAALPGALAAGVAVRDFDNLTCPGLAGAPPSLRAER